MNKQAPMIANLFAELPRLGSENEQFLTLTSQPGLRIERIVSTGQSSPPDFWYDQPGGECVVLIQGEAKLRFADEDVARHLKTGDFLEIPKHCRHRIEWTPSAEVTIWLAIHY